MSKVKVTQFKTKRINKVSGGKISSHEFDGGLLMHSFVSKNDDYIGDYALGWRYVQRNLRVCDDHPIGVAEKYDDDGNLEGYYGYSHRGGNLFKIGDRLFDQHYRPNRDDYDEDQWREWENDFIQKREAADDFDRDSIYDSISSVIPFRMRGKKNIETWEDAKQAAINMSDYLS